MSAAEASATETFLYAAQTGATIALLATRTHMSTEVKLYQLQNQLF
jgi:hypothetical protein